MSWMSTLIISLSLLPSIFCRAFSLIFIPFCFYSPPYIRAVLFVTNDYDKHNYNSNKKERSMYRNEYPLVTKGRRVTNFIRTTFNARVNVISFRFVVCSDARDASSNGYRRIFLTNCPRSTRKNYMITRTEEPRTNQRKQMEAGVFSRWMTRDREGTNTVNDSHQTFKLYDSR